MRAERRNEWRAAILWSAAASVILLLLCSMSSPLYPINIWDDANCLLTVGRVMKAGGVLYRDVYEQKGPLLYLIHMLAACMSDRSFFGVYVMEVLAFAVTLCFAERTIRLRASRFASRAGMLLFGCAVVVSRAFARGDSAEEFCLPFLMAALYIVCRHGKRAEGALPGRSVFLLGLLAGCVATIKYTVLGLFIGLCLAQGIVLLKKKDAAAVLCSAGAFLAGMALPILPWIGYFAANGALQDFYTAYIHNNIFLYNAGQSALIDQAISVLRTGKENWMFALPAALGVCAFLLDRARRGFASMAVVLGAVCACAAVFLLGSMYPYYPLVLCVYAPMGFGVLLSAAERQMKSGRLLVTLSAGLALCAAVLMSPNAFLRGVPLADTAQGRLAAQMEPGASLLQYSHLDDGLYLTSGALPEEKYFVRLNVNLDRMQDALDEAVREGRPDYVLVSWRELPKEFERYEMIAYDTGYDDDGRLNKDLYLYKRVDK